MRRECVPLFTCGMFFLYFGPKCIRKLKDIKIGVNKKRKVYLELRSRQRKVKLRNQLLLDVLRHWFNKSQKFTLK